MAPKTVKKFSTNIPIPEIPAQEVDNPETPLYNQVKGRNQNTVRFYYTVVAEFFDYLFKKPLPERYVTRGQKRDNTVYEKLTQKYFDSERDHEKDLIGFLQHLKSNNFAPLSIRGYMSVIREVMRFNGVIISDKTNRLLRKNIPRKTISTKFDYADKKILADILLHCDARMSAFVLFLVSSGCRVGEALSVRIDDVKIPDRSIYPNKPASVYIRSFKTSPARTTYISRECETAIKEWGKVRDAYISVNRKRGLNITRHTQHILRDERLLFPWCVTRAEFVWKTTLKKAGYGGEDKPYRVKRIKLNLHRLRNFFNVALTGVVGPDIPNLLMGHVDRYGGAYIGRSEEDIEKAYVLAEPAITIGTITVIDERTQQQISKMEHTLAELQAKVSASDEIIRIFKSLPQEKQVEFEKYLVQV